MTCTIYILAPIHETTEYLEAFLRNLLLNEKNELHKSKSSYKWTFLKKLTQRYGKGYDRSNLYHCLKFYKTFPEIVDNGV